MVESFPKQFFMMFKLPLILACAIAETGWSPMSVRSWENFRRKLADHRQFILKRFNYNMERTKENEPPFK